MCECECERERVQILKGANRTGSMTAREKVAGPRERVNEKGRGRIMSSSSFFSVPPNLISEVPLARRRRRPWRVSPRPRSGTNPVTLGEGRVAAERGWWWCVLNNLYDCAPAAVQQATRQSSETGRTLNFPTRRRARESKRKSLTTTTAGEFEDGFLEEGRGREIFFPKKDAKIGGILRYEGREVFPVFFSIGVGFFRWESRRDDAEWGCCSRTFHWRIIRTEWMAFVSKKITYRNKS